MSCTNFFIIISYFIYTKSQVLKSRNFYYFSSFTSSMDTSKITLFFNFQLPIVLYEKISPIRKRLVKSGSESQTRTPMAPVISNFWNTSKVQTFLSILFFSERAPKGDTDPNFWRKILFFKKPSHQISRILIILGCIGYKFNDHVIMGN